MARTTVAEIVDTASGTGAPVARVQWDAEWEEFRVVFTGRPKADYHTDSRSDATGTAMAQSRQIRPDAHLVLITRRGFGTKGQQ